VGLGERNNKHRNPKPQVEAKYNDNRQASARNAGYEEVACRVKSSENIEAGKTSTDGTSSRARSGHDHIVGGGE
jgi:hypothetical protein